MANSSSRMQYYNTPNGVRGNQDNSTSAGRQQFNSSVQEMQTSLRDLSFIYPDIPTIIPDGIFGLETTEAVLAFQRQFGLTPTGKIDLETWNAILEAHRQIQAESSLPMAIRPFPGNNYLLSVNNEGDLVYIVQIMLKDIGKVFSNIANVQVTGAYDVFTQNAVREIQKASGLEPTGNVNSRTWDKIASMYEMYRTRTE